MNLVWSRLRRPRLSHFLPHPQAPMGDSRTWEMNVRAGSPQCGRRGHVSHAGGILKEARVKVRHQKPDSRPCGGGSPEKTGKSLAGKESRWRLPPILPTFLGCCLAGFLGQQWAYGQGRAPCAPTPPPAALPAPLPRLLAVAQSPPTQVDNVLSTYQQGFRWPLTVRSGEQG